MSDLHTHLSCYDMFQMQDFLATLLGCFNIAVLLPLLA
jgi:hypothetical protein